MISMNTNEAVLSPGFSKQKKRRKARITTRAISAPRSLLTQRLAVCRRIHSHILPHFTFKHLFSHSLHFLHFFFAAMAPLVCHFTFCQTDDKHRCPGRLQTFVKAGHNVSDAAENRRPFSDWTKRVGEQVFGGGYLPPLEEKK